MHFALSKIHYWGQKLSERTNKSLSKQNTFAHVIMEQTCFFYLQVAQSHLSIHFFPPNEEETFITEEHKSAVQRQSQLILNLCELQ